MSTTQTINVADKVTLDSVNSKVTNIAATPAITYDATAGETKVYDPVNEEYVTMQTGGGGSSSNAKPSIVIINKAETMNNVNVTCTSDDGFFTNTINMGTNNSIDFVLPYLGDYTVSWTNVSGQVITRNITVDSVGGVNLFAANFVSFSTCTDAQLSELLDLHYAGTINLYDCWSIGDTRTISLY